MSQKKWLPWVIDMWGLAGEIQGKTKCLILNCLTLNFNLLNFLEIF